MSYNKLNISSKKAPKRVGRGISAGQGKTAGRGTKGQKSRTGYSAKAGFEGGQNPLIQRFPKLRGFTSHRVPAENVYTGQLDNLGETISNQTLAEAGLIAHPYSRVKLVVKGEVNKKHTVNLQGASASAVAMVQKDGGSFDKIERIKRPASKLKIEK
ncbi:50S ribosomal protein L15 [Candidatus Saccharibacteria bacterium]|nr:50S ribosomal protein L15 [Candidatus Saccharibacteria bacterium]